MNKQTWKAAQAGIGVAVIGAAIAATRYHLERRKLAPRVVRLLEGFAGPVIEHEPAPEAAPVKRGRPKARKASTAFWPGADYPIPPRYKSKGPSPIIRVLFSDGRTVRAYAPSKPGKPINVGFACRAAIRKHGNGAAIVGVTDQSGMVFDATRIDAELADVRKPWTPQATPLAPGWEARFAARLAAARDAVWFMSRTARESAAWSARPWGDIVAEVYAEARP